MASLPRDNVTTPFLKHSSKPMSLKKIVVAGDLASGKTNLLNRITGKAFVAQHQISPGVNFESFDGLQFIDTTGEARFAIMLKPYLTKADALLLCMDMSKQTESGSSPTDFIQQHIQQLKTLCDIAADSDFTAPLHIVLTKADLYRTRLEELNEILLKICASKDYSFSIHSSKEAVTYIDKEQRHEPMAALSPLIDRLPPEPSAYVGADGSSSVSYGTYNQTDDDDAGCCPCSCAFQ